MSADRLEALVAALKALEERGQLYPALRQVFSMLAFSCEAAADPEAEAEALLKSFLNDFQEAAVAEATGRCICAASARTIMIGGRCNVCGGLVLKVVPS